MDENGLVTAHKTGRARIRAFSADGSKVAVCNVTVIMIPVTSFELNTEKISGSVGTQYQLAAENILPLQATYSTIEWESDHPQVATVDENGLVTMNHAGMAVISAYANERQVAEKCLVIVEGDKETVPDVEYLTPQDYRRVNEVDDTEAFNRAFNRLSDDCNTVFVPEGIYRIDADIAIQPKSNTNLIMSPNAVLIAEDNSGTHYNVIYVRDVSNVSISGGNIVGERYTHDGTSGEWGMGIGIYDSTNISVSDVDISDCWGDGIYVGSKRDDEPGAGSSYVSISDCYLINNRRNNMSIVCVDNIEVDGCRFENANGTAPEYGIDIETNNSDNPCEHIRISNCTFNGNKEAALGIVREANDIELSNCTLNGLFVNWNGTNVKLSGCTINGVMAARYGVTLTDGTVINDGGSKEDVLVATYDADVEITQKSGKYISLKNFDGGMTALKSGVTYRFEYVVKGTGQWDFMTNQTGWYPVCPVEDEYFTCYTTYRAKSASECKLHFYADNYTSGSKLIIDSIKIYEVK